MRNKSVQMTLADIYDGVCDSIENNKPELIVLLEEHLNFDKLIPVTFHTHFYRGVGRNHIYHLESFIKAFVLQKLLGIPTVKLLVIILRTCAELREFCEFDTVPYETQFSRFRKNHLTDLQKMFEHLVEFTEPICREISEKKSDYLIYDTTGIELRVKENNPKFFNTKLESAKKLAKNNPNYDPYKSVYRLLPNASDTNPAAKQQYINGHFTYALKAGILTNGLGIVRHISVFDDDFKSGHPELDFTKSDNPEKDKELGDSTSLRPALSDFFAAHPTLKYGTFLGDSAFDSYDNYSMLKNDFEFKRACIPMNIRNSKTSNAFFDDHGTPICPLDSSPFIYLGKSGGKNRSVRFKWVCPKSEAIGSSRICTCETPCTDSSYGKCVYTYPDKNFRLYPGIARDTEHWDNLYEHRVLIERTINLLKDSFAVDSQRSFHTITVKADLFLAGIVQLIGVILAHSLHKPELYKSVRKLIA